MKSLILFRHGKSDWNAATVTDHDRPVNPRGVRAAQAMGRFLKLAGQQPQSVVASSALRARSTAELAIAAGKWDSALRVTRALYEATPLAVLEEVRAEPETTSTLLLAGHEPTSSELLALLVGGVNAHFPTAAMARVDLQIDTWKQAASGCGVLIWLVPPKLFTQGEFAFAR